MRVLINTSPLITLDRIGRPQSVVDELVAGQERIRDVATLLHAEWIVTEPDPPEMALRKELGAGETAVLALAHKQGADLVILDDLQARLVASELGLRITGTLGVLLAAQQRGLSKDWSSAIRDLRVEGFHVSEALLKKFEKS